MDTNKPSKTLGIGEGISPVTVTGMCLNEECIALMRDATTFEELMYVIVITVYFPHSVKCVS